MNIIKKSIAVAFGLTALCGSVEATTIELQSGNLVFDIRSYDAGNLYFQQSNGSVCSGISNCALTAADPTKGSLAPNGAPYGDSSWGVFTITSISDISTNTAIYTEGQNGKYLTGMFGGLQDYSVTVGTDSMGNTTTTVLDKGGWLNVYQNTAELNPGSPTLHNGPLMRTGQYSYTGVTNGLLMLSAQFASDGVQNDYTSTYASSYDPVSIFGNGFGFLNVTGGAWDTKSFEKGAYKDPFTGQFYDLKFSDTYSPDDSTTADGWTVLAAGQASGKVPEPGSIAMIGLGLAALARLRRRKS